VSERILRAATAEQVRDRAKKFHQQIKLHGRTSRHRRSR
jgi:hypothetical protein